MDTIYLLPGEERCVDFRDANGVPKVHYTYVVKYMHLEKYFSGATIPHIYFRDYKTEEFKVNALCVVQDVFTGRNALVVHGFCHQGGKGSGQFIGLLPAHADGQAALRVSVHQQDFFALHRQPNA